MDVSDSASSSINQSNDGKVVLLADMESQFLLVKQKFLTGETKSLEWREKQLRGIETFVEENKNAIISALFDDLGKPRIEALASEIVQVSSAAANSRKNLKNWTKPTKVSTNLTNFPASSLIIPQPLGVVLIISPWNFPFLLAMEPLVAAIAAGNAVILKPSEISASTSQLLSRLSDYVDSDAIRVIQGGIPVASALLEKKWDKIFYTGSTAVGRIVATAAAKNLTPVVLELGGKSPAIVDSNIDIKVCAQRIAFGSFMNAGQCCVACDYILVEESIANKLVDAIVLLLSEWYGAEGKPTKDLSRIINLKQFERLEAYLASPEVQGRIVFGGKMDKSIKFISPTIVRDIPWDSPMMNEEIFGPILPIQTVSSIRDAVRIVNEKPKPLALYVFSRDSKVVEFVLNETSSGGACVNDALMHVGNPALPFGGVGDSGYGSYHGKYSFDAFSHSRAVLKKDFGLEIPAKFPPYNTYKENLITALISGNIVGVLLILLGLRK